MEKYQKYNKRRKSITEFRSSYSDNKKYFISTDRKSSWMPVVKYITIAIFFIVFVIAGFLITDALLEISEAPYVAEETTVREEKTEIDKITQAFYMVDKSRSRKEGGAGLGMTLCQEIIHLHRGTIRAYNGETGAVFEISIPVSR